MQHRDIEVLAFARMNEKKTGILLAEYYNSSFSYFGDPITKKGDLCRHFILAKKLALFIGQKMFKLFDKRVQNH